MALALPRSIAPVIAEQLAFIESERRTPAEVESAFRAMTDVVSENITYAESLGADAHDALSALEKTRASVYALRTRYFRGFERVRRVKVPQTMALWEFARFVYGDATKAPLLYLANAVADVTAVPAGTELIVLPAE
jgi:hypothetical protein